MANAGLLLTTKLFAPPRRANPVARARLLTRMTNACAAGQKILLVSAPAGFGKTTLVSEWCHSQDAAVAWVALDAADNDPARFFAYLFAAFQQTAPERFAPLAALMTSAQPPAPETLAAQCLNALGEIAQPPILVLDDYQLIENQVLHNAVELFATHAPPAFMLVLTARSDPPLPLARWRARGLLAEIRADDLRFTADEAREFLQRAVNLNWSASDLAALQERTEGWAAGLQLAALAIQRADDPHAFITAFTGSHRFVLDYLVQEVLQQQSEPFRNFLLATCLLERFNAALCDAVLENMADASQATLTQLERANLFLIPLDETRTWFRYHHLFADVLRNHLQQTDAARIPILHARAGEWFARHDLVNEAVTHLLAAREWERAAELLDAHLAEWLVRGEYVLLGQWLNALPPDVLHAHPLLALARVTLAIAANQLDTAERLLNEIQTQIETPSPAVRGEILSRRASIAYFRNQLESSLAHANAALEILPPDASRLRTETLFTQGLVLGALGRLPEMLNVMTRVSEVARAAGDHFHFLYAEFQIGAIHYSAARLHRAAETYRSAIAHAHAHGLGEMMLVGWLYSDLSGILFEWNQVAEARESAARALAYAQRGAMPRMQVMALERQCEIAFGLQDYAEMERMLDRAEMLVRQHQLAARYSGIIQAKRVLWWLATNQLSAAQRWVRDFETKLTDTIFYAREAETLALVRVDMAQANYSRAFDTLRRLYDTASDAGRRGDTLPLGTLRICILAAQGERTQAVALAGELVAATTTENYVRLFVSEGEPMRVVLQTLRAQWKSASVPAGPRAHLENILAAFPAAPAPPAPVTTKHPALMESLTERETQMLHLIARGYTDREISAQLHISPATVKKHLSNLFGKLDVHSRTQALARARDLGLL